MKIRKPIPMDKIPKSVRGKKRADKYDTLTERILSQPPEMALPIDVKTISEAGCITSALRTRSDKIKTRRAGLVLYVWHESAVQKKSKLQRIERSILR